jgi:hypothetical protein
VYKRKSHLCRAHVAHALLVLELIVWLIIFKKHVVVVFGFRFFVVVVQLLVIVQPVFKLVFIIVCLIRV